jgi:hypothetical protein
VRVRSLEELVSLLVPQKERRLTQMSADKSEKRDTDSVRA